jgi:type I restriction enzyme S subunit
MKWRMVTLKEVANIVGGSTPSRDREEYWNGLIPWLTPTDLPMPGKGIADVNDTSSKITKEGLSAISSQLLPVGTVLFSSRATIGKLGISKVPLVTNQGFANFIPKKIVESKYLAYCLLYFMSDITALAGSTTFKEVTKTALKKFKIPLPPISEQHRIVEILDQADALRKKRAEADAKAARILPALFYKMFGDPFINLKGWHIKPLSEFEAKVRYGLGQPPKAFKHGVALIRATNISRGTISLKNMIYVDPQDVPEGKDAFLKEDEVIVVRSGAYTGDTAQVTKEWEGCVAGYDLVITPGMNLTGEFIESYLLSPFVQKGYFQNLKARAGQPHLNSAQVAATPFFEIPFDLQKHFAEDVRSIRALKKKILSASEKIGRVFDVLLHQAFNGNLTANWREAHLKELLVEMEKQAKQLNLQVCEI